MKTRAFNSISVDIHKGILTKTSSNILKLKNEIDYYLKLRELPKSPKNILNFFPDLIDYDKNFTSYRMKFVPYKSLAELILANNIDLDEAKDILKKLFDMLDEIHATKLVEAGSITDKNFLIQKTIDRVAALKDNKSFKHLTEDALIINNKLHQNFNHYQKQFTEILTKFFVDHPVITVIHGDFCFSNILYCPNIKDIKLVDPRGSFGSEGIYGHPYYDYAKLMHCAHGNYDQIVAGNFKFTAKTSTNYELDIASSPIFMELYGFFKNLLHERSFDVEILHLIEASLFLSMAPLHYEDPDRQKALFLNGLILINNFFERRYANMR